MNLGKICLAQVCSYVQDIVYLPVCILCLFEYYLVEAEASLIKP